MRKRVLTLSAAALAFGLLGVPGTSPALADPGDDTGDDTDATASEESVASFTAILTGDQEVPDPKGPAVGDDDGQAVALVKVKGDRVVFSLKWKGIQPPQAGHIHVGEAGENGDVKVPLFESAMPKTVRAAAGQASIESAEVAESILEHPEGFYVNLHTKKFGGGAVRGQLKPLKKQINPLDIIKAGKLRAQASGFQEVSDKGIPLVGDLDGFGVAFVDPEHDKARYSAAWLNIGAPVAAHVHEGGIGKNGKVRFPLFTEPVPKNIFAISGIVSKLDPKGLKHITENSEDFYFNLHNKKFADGAIRGQLLAH